MLQQIGSANVVGPPSHFEQLVAIRKIETAPTKFQIQADDNGWSGHLLHSNFYRANDADDEPMAFANALNLGKSLICRVLPSPRLAAAQLLAGYLRVCSALFRRFAQML